MRIQEALSRVAQQLKEKEIETPMLEAQLLLSYLLQQEKEYILNHGDEIFSKKIEQKMYSILGERIKGKPLAYILGYKDFFGHRFSVSSSVLIPRPDTECILEKTIEYVQKNNLQDKVRFFEMGTGSGAVAISFSLYFPSIPVYGIDISPEALEISDKNSKALQAYNIKWILSDLFQSINFLTLEKFSQRTSKEKLSTIYSKKSHGIFFANLPYIPTLEIQELDESVKFFEPHLALDGGEDGLFIFRRFFQEIQKIQYQAFFSNITIFFECDPSQFQSIEKEIQILWKNLPVHSIFDLSHQIRGGFFEF